MRLCDLVAPLVLILRKSMSNKFIQLYRVSLKRVCLGFYKRTKYRLNVLKNAFSRYKLGGCRHNIFFSKMPFKTSNADLTFENVLGLLFKDLKKFKL